VEKGGSRGTLVVGAVGLLLGLGVLVSLVDVGGALGAVLFAVVVLLVGLLVYLAVVGEMRELAQHYGIRPGVVVLVILLLGIAFFAFRIGLLQAGR
jgi:hypothetical protein